MHRQLRLSRQIFPLVLLLVFLSPLLQSFFSLEQQQDALHGGGRLLDALCGVGSRLLVLGIMHCAAATISCCHPRPAAAAAAAEDLPRTLLISVHANLTQTLCF